MAVTPLNAIRPPEVSDLLGEIGRGVIPDSRQVVAAVEAYPGPIPDWRSLLVTETLRETLQALGIRRGESAVIAPRNASGKEVLRYKRSGWRPYRMDDLMAGVLGDKDYRRCLAKSAPRQRQAQIKKMLADLSAPNSALWPVMRVLDAFYLSDDDTPSKKHLSSWAINEDDIVQWARMLWERQRSDPIGSGLGLSREAMPKYWQHRHGGIWPELPPDLPPKLIVVANAEELTESELRLIAGQPCPVLCFGDPAAGVKGASLEAINTLPLGSKALGELHATTLGCELGLERAIRHVIRNDTEIPDAWVQTLGALSAVALSRERPGFATYRKITHTPQAMPHYPPLASPDAQPGAIISRTGVSAIRHLLDAMRPERRTPPEERPKLKIHMDAGFSQLVKEAHEVAQLYYLPEAKWERSVAQRYRKGREAALDMCSGSPLKAAFLDLFRQRNDPALAGVLKLIGSIEFRGTRVIHASGLKDADQANGQETTLHIGDPPDLLELKGEPVTIVEAELEDVGSGQAQAACLYRMLVQRPLQISRGSEEAIEFLERSHDWMAARRRPDDATPTSGIAPDGASHRPPSKPSPPECGAHESGHPKADDAPIRESSPREERRSASPAPSSEPHTPELDKDGAASGPMAAGADLTHNNTSFDRQTPPIEMVSESTPAPPVPPALRDWSSDALDDARLHEATMMDHDLEAALQEYHQPASRAGPTDSQQPEGAEAPIQQVEQTAVDRNLQNMGMSQDQWLQDNSPGDTNMDADVNEEGQRRQAELRGAWSAAAEGIMSRKAGQQPAGQKPYKSPSPGT